MASLSEFSIRRLTIADADAVAELSGQLGYPVSSEDLRGRLEDLYLSGERVAFAADAQGKLAGWIDASIERHLQSPACVVIGGLVVRDELRGLGIGKRLCEAIEAWTRSKSIPCHRVRSQKARAAAHRFYLRDNAAAGHSERSWHLCPNEVEESRGTAPTSTAS